ncbi:hypothetical protein ACFL60_09065 [Candidatus Omnitrophota bacterium]
MIPENEALQIYESWRKSGGTKTYTVLSNESGRDYRTCKKIIIDYQQQDMNEMKLQILNNGEPDEYKMKQLAEFQLLKAVADGQSWAIRYALNRKIKAIEKAKRKAKEKNNDYFDIRDILPD